MNQNRGRRLAVGTVRVWHEVSGWGVITSLEVAAEVWAHFSLIATEGDPVLRADDHVLFSWEEVPQDGFRFRAVQIYPHSTDGV